MWSPRRWTPASAAAVVVSACYDVGPVDPAEAGNPDDGSGTWQQAGAGDMPSEVAVAPDERYLYALDGRGVIAVDLDTGEATAILRDGEVRTWGLFFGDDEVIVIGAVHTSGAGTRIWRLLGTEIAGSTELDLDAEAALVSPTGDWVYVEDLAGFTLISTADLSTRRVDNVAEVLTTSRAWVPARNTLLRANTLWDTTDSDPVVTLEACDLDGGGCNELTELPGQDYWLPPTLVPSPDGRRAAVSLTGEGRTATVDLSTGTLHFVDGVDGPVGFLPNGSALLGWSSPAGQLRVDRNDGLSTHLRLPSTPAWVALEDSNTLVASVHREDSVELWILDIARLDRFSLPDRFELGSVALRGDRVFLAAPEAEPAGLHLLDTRARSLDWLGLEATTVTHLPQRDLLLVDSPGDLDVYRLVDPETLEVVAWLTW